MDAAILTTTTDVAVGFGLLSFYSSAVDVETTMAVSVLVTVAVVVVVATTMAIAVNGSSFFLFSSAAAETMVPAANFFTGAVFAAPSYISSEGFGTHITNKHERHKHKSLSTIIC